MITTNAQPATATCGDILDSAIGTIVCDLPAGHGKQHVGGDRTYWIDRTDENVGYVKGLRKAVDWLQWIAEAPPEAGLDIATIHRMAEGLKAVASSAAERLGVDETT